MNPSAEVGSQIPTGHEIFLDALEIIDDLARAEFLRVACRGHAELQHQVETLLQHHSRAGQFLETPLLHREHVCSLILETPTLAGTRFDDRYRLLKLLGTGGMGQVWLAEQLMAENRHVAVKLLHPGADSGRSLPRFRAELQVLTRLHHPHIASVLDGGMTQHGLPFFVMEFVNGKPLCEYCDTHQLSLKARLKLFIIICRAVHYAHEQGVIHRDLKPGNLLIEDLAGHPTPRVIDFGLARLIDDSSPANERLTEHGWYLGTPEYMSPEQMTASVASLDPRADVYSLGVILFELLTGQTPFRCVSREPAALPDFFTTVRLTDPPQASAAAAAAKSEDAAAARSLSRQALATRLAGDLDWITLKALDKSPSARYASAADLASDIERHLNSQPVSAHPPDVLYRLRKHWSRHRAIAANIAVSLVALIAVLAFGTWAQLVQLQTGEARDRAADQAKAAEEIALDKWRESAELQRRVATQHHQVGLLLQDLKRFDESHTELQQAAETFKQLIDRFPLDLELRRSLANVLDSLAIGCIRQRKHGEAKGFLAEALNIRKQLSQASPDQHELLDEMAITLHNYATTVRISADGSEVLPLHAQLYAVRKKLLTTDPQNLVYAWQMAFACTLYGDGLLQKQDMDTAEKVLDDGLHALQQFMLSKPEVMQHKELQTKLLSSLAEVHISRNCWDQAERLLRQCVATRSPYAQHPATGTFLVRCHTSLARVLCESSRPEQARKELQTAEELVNRLPDTLPEIAATRQSVQDAFRMLATSTPAPIP